MGRHLKYSLILHASLLAFLVAWTFLVPPPRKKSLQFFVLPKGTSLDATLTQEVVDAIQNPAHPSRQTPTPTASRGPELSPTPSTEATPPPTPTPILIASPTPAPTQRATPTPQKTIAVTPKATPKITPKSSPKAQPNDSPPKDTPTPKASPTAAKSAKSTPTPKGAKAQAKATPTKKPKATPKMISSAYDIAQKPADGNRFADTELPAQTPANAEVAKAAANQEVGVPGVPEGVEGAPLPLDRSQNLLSMLYTTRARMKIQGNFTAPPGVNDPDMTCVVEWEILRDGTIENIRVVKSTGVPQYDSRAIEALLKTQNLGPLPPELGDRSVWTSLTFFYTGDIAPPPQQP
jgi:TonB family protein